MSAELSLSMRTSRDELRRVHAEIGEFAREEGWSARLDFQINLVVEEVAMNVLNHGHDDGGEHEIGIDLASNEKEIVIEIVDDGRPYDPLTQAPQADTASPLQDRPVGGLGVYLVCALMDEASYRRDGDFNRLSLVKKRPA